MSPCQTGARTATASAAELAIAVYESLARRPESEFQSSESHERNLT
jgi:hypothetical protein